MTTFATLYEQFSLGVSVEQMIGRLRQPDWVAFLRAHQAVLEASPCPAEQCLSLAQGHASSGEISQQADAWLRQHQPHGGWLRLAQRPEREPPPPPTLFAHEGGAVLSVAVSADGRRAYSGGHDNCLRVWGPVPAVRRYSGSVSRVALGGGLLVVESGSQCETTLRILDLDSLDERAVHQPSTYVLDVCFEGDDIYYAGWDKQVWKWNWTTGAVHLLEGYHDDHITVLTRFGRYLVSGCADGSLGLWEGLHKVGHLPAHEGRVAALAASQEGLLSSAYDGFLKLWDLEQGLCRQQWEIRPNRGCSLAVGASLSQVVVADDPQVFLLDLKTGRRRVVESGVKSVSSLAITSDERYVLCGSIGQVRVWDLESEQQMPAPRSHGPEPARLCFQSMVFSPDGETVISGTLGGKLLLWDFLSGACLASLEGHRGEITSVLLSPDGSLALSGGGSQDYRAHTWALPGGDCVHIYEGHRHRVFVEGINDSHALSTSWDGSSHLWDLRSGELLWSQSGFLGFLTRAGLRELRGDELYSPLEQRPLGRLEGLVGALDIFASSRPFGVTRTEPYQVWDLEVGRRLGQIPCRPTSPPRPVLAGDLLALASSPRELALFDLSRPERSCRWCFSHRINSLALHTSGRLAVALEDGQLQFLHWEWG